MTTAILVCVAWMSILGFSPEEIEEACKEKNICLVEEMRQYEAALRLSK